MTFVQSVAGLIISTLCSEFISNDGADMSLRLGLKGHRSWRFCPQVVIDAEVTGAT